MAKLLLVVDMQNDFVTGVLGSKYGIFLEELLTQKALKFLIHI